LAESHRISKTRALSQIRIPKSTIRDLKVRGTASAEEKVGKHEMERAPAAITSLSAACRCASRPPSNPSA